MSVLHRKSGPLASDTDRELPRAKPSGPREATGIFEKTVWRWSGGHGHVACLRLAKNKTLADRGTQSPRWPLSCAACCERLGLENRSARPDRTLPRCCTDIGKSHPRDRVLRKTRKPHRRRTDVDGRVCRDRLQILRGLYDDQTLLDIVVYNKQRMVLNPRRSRRFDARGMRCLWALAHAVDSLAQFDAMDNVTSLPQPR